MNRTEKQELIDDLHSEFGKSMHAILVDFRGLTVPAVTEFRRKLRQSGSRYRVVKNSLALRAVKDTPLEKLASKFENTTGVAYTGADPVALAKALVDFAKEHPLSTMPSLPELRSRLLGLFSAPGTKLVRLLNAPATKLVQVMRAYQDKQEGK
jgi:large subunit ribosomal protein L10